MHHHNRNVDRDIATDLLLSSKQMSSTLHMGILESANDHVRHTFKQAHDRELSEQGRISSTMINKGWYQVERAQRGH